MFKCQKPIIMCFVLPDQCFQTGISDWHFLSEDKSDENFLSENTSVKKKCQKIQIKLCQWCFLSPNPLTTYLSLKVCVWHSYNLGWELCMYSELGEGSRRESITRPQIPICPVWQLNPLSLNKPPPLQHKWPMFWGREIFLHLVSSLWSKTIRLVNEWYLSSLPLSMRKQ